MENISLFLKRGLFAKIHRGGAKSLFLVAITMMLISSCAQSVGGGGGVPALNMNDAEKVIAGKIFSNYAETYSFDSDKTGTMTNTNGSARAVSPGNFTWSASNGSGGNINIVITQSGNNTSATYSQNNGKGRIEIGDKIYEDKTPQGTVVDAVVEEMNLVRADPSDYAEKYIEPLLNSVALIAPNEGASVINGLITELKSISAGRLHPFSEEIGLRRAAYDHAKDQGAKGTVEHNGSDGSTFDSRIRKYGTINAAGGSLGENISTGYKDARKIVIQLLVDDGIANRGHRKNILSSTYTQAGSYTTVHTKYDYISVIDFASGYRTNSGVQNVIGSISDRMDSGSGNGEAPSSLVGTMWTASYQFGLHYAMVFKDANTVAFGHCYSAEQALRFAKQPTAANCNSQQILNYTYDNATGSGTLRLTSGNGIPGVIGDGKFVMQNGKLITKDSGWGGDTTFTRAN